MCCFFLYPDNVGNGAVVLYLFESSLKTMMQCEQFQCVLFKIAVLVDKLDNIGKNNS